MPSVVLDRDNFFRRMKRLYTAWKDGKTETGEPFPKVDSIYTAIGSDDYVLYCKSLSLQIWLLGYDINDVIMIFTKNSIHFLASKKKIDFLRQVEQCKDKKSIPPIKFHLRIKESSEKENFEKLIAAMEASGEGKTLGVFVKDEFPGPLVESWKKVLKQQSFENVDISNALAILLSVKDEAELTLVKKACQVSVDVYQKYLRDQIMDTVDSNKKVKHAKLADGVENAMTDRKYVGSNVDTSQLATCYPPIIQSGGNYSLKFSAQSDQKNLHFGVIICSFGARYKMYCSNIIRTLLVNPNDSVQENYNFLVDLQEHLISVLKPGIQLCDVYNSGIEFAREKKPSLVDKLTKNFGFVTGIEFRENSLAITSKTTACARKSQVYNLCVGLSNLINEEADSKENKNYSLFIGDTVVVNEDGPPTVLTNSKKRIKNVGIFLKDDEEDEDEESEKENQSQRTPNLRRTRRTTVLDSRLREDTASEENRKQHQEELTVKMHEEARQRLLGLSSGTQSERTSIRKSKISYKNYDQMPVDPEVKQLKIFVDKKYETVILPIFGLPVPFHISMIKNISQSVEGDYTYLRINFFCPGTTVTKEGLQFANPDATFAKEISYRSTNLRKPGETSAPSSNLNNAFHSIKEVQKTFKTREAEEKEKADLVKQDTIIISSNKGNPKLKDLLVKPNIVNKKMSGSLEAHVNGFRYTTVRGDRVDILYNNIKHAFFQPGDGEMIILLHFHLKNAIMFGKKKHFDVQFYTEFGEASTDLGKNQHMHDRDGLAAEQAERELRQKLKIAFKTFCDKVETATRRKVDFDSPMRDLAFPGVPFRSTVLLEPSTHCLVNLTEWPPFVIALDDIELVYFERVDFTLKSFDMALIFKDYYKKVETVSTIPMTELSTIKGWLDHTNIVYMEGKRNLNWPNIMKKITNNLKAFFEDGGWRQINPDSNTDDEGDAEESSSEGENYDVSDAESSEDESEDDSDISKTSEDSDSEEEELDSSEESGKDWSDLEREAEAEDHQRDADFHGEFSRSKNKSHHRSPPKISSRDSEKHHKSSHSSSRAQSSHHSSSRSQSSNHHSSSRSHSSNHHSSSHRTSSSHSSKKKH